MLKTYQYRIYPTAKQRVTLESWLDACQNLYNQGLAMRIETLKKTASLSATIVKRGCSPRFAVILRFGKASILMWLQDTLRRLDKAYDAFYRRLKAGEDPGFPRFKGRGRYRSITFSHLSVNLIRTIRRKFARVVVPKIGQVKMRYHRPLPEGHIKTLTIQRKASGWYANITVELPDVPKVEIQSAVGVDVGLESFLTTSEGDKVENPRHLRHAEDALKKKQRHLARGKKGSARKRKQNTILAKHHEHVANQRRDFHYKTAHRLFSQYDAVVIEGLTIDNMKRNHYLAKSISDAGWGNFRLALASKAENAGKLMLEVPPHGTSQVCSGCGRIAKKSLSIRTHRCDCGLTLDRDHNAAINILGAATALRGGVVGPITPERPARERSEKPVSPTDWATSPVPLGQGS